MDKDTRIPKRMALGIGILCTLAGAAFLVLDFLKGSTSIVLGALPYLMLVPFLVVLIIMSRKKGEGIYGALPSAIVVLFGLVMAISDRNRSWP